MMFWILTVVAAFAAWLYWNVKNQKLLEMSKKIPGPPALPIIGNAWKFICQPEEFVRVIRNLIDDYGGVSKVWLGSDLCIVITEPEELRIFLSSPKTSTKGQQYKYMAEVLGGGLLSGSGPMWRKHRKVSTPNYSKKSVASYGPVFNEEARNLLKKLESVPKGKLCDIYSEIVKTTSYCVCRTFMGLSREEMLTLPHLQTLIDDTPRIYDITFERMTKWYLQMDPIFWLTPSYKEREKFIERTTEFSKTVVDYRQKRLKKLGVEDTIDLYDEEDEKINKLQLSIIDRFILSKELETPDLLKETFTIFTTSQEAAAKISSSIILMMASHPDCQEKLYDEIRNVMGDIDRDVTDEDIKSMPYLDMVFKETIRLFPIGALLQREVTEELPLNSVTLTPGCSVVIPIYHIQRDRRFWENPDAFDPERFTPENIKKRHPYCYIPFSLGPMDCVGRYYGTKVMKTICIKVLQKYKVWTPKKYEDMRFGISISVVSIDGYDVALTPRDAKN